MAIQTGKNCIVGSVAVTVCAAAPFAPVLSRIYREKQRIMFSELGGFPTGHGGVALHANIVNSGWEMIGIGSGIVIRFMTGEAICGYIGIFTRDMTLVAVVDGMTLGEWKAGMIKSGRLPPGHGGMTLHANIVNSGNKVVGIGCGIVFHLMTWETLCGYIGIVTRIVTFIAIIDGMPQGEGKVDMFVLCRFPSGHGGMALHTHIWNTGS
jgi:hypothetical protein